MTKTLTILGLGGSMAKVSSSRAALVQALGGAASAGAGTELLDIRDLDLPMYNPDDEPSAAATRLIESCYGADGMLWSSPMYQGSIAGAFKNALDWLHLLRDRDPPFLHDKSSGSSARRAERTGFRQSTRWSSPSGPSVGGPCP